MSQYDVFDLHMALSAWSLFYSIVCVCLKYLLCVMREWNNVVSNSSLHPSNRNRPSHCQSQGSQHRMTALWEGSHRTWGERRPTDDWGGSGAGRRLLNIWVDTRTTEVCQGQNKQDAQWPGGSGAFSEILEWHTGAWWEESWTMGKADIQVLSAGWGSNHFLNPLCHWRLLGKGIITWSILLILKNI